MKYAIVIPDGAADLPLDELDGRTPLAAAKTPNMDWVAAHGKIGTVRTVPPGLSCGSDVAIMSVLGYDPKRYYTGRAPLEAAAQNIEVSPTQWVFRCNLVTVVDGCMEDHSAGHISSEEAATLIAELNRLLGGSHITFYAGVGYRHLMTYDAAVDVRTTPPHDILDKPIAEHLPTGQGAEMLRTLIDRSRQILTEHEINTVRRDLGENPASSIWLWGQGKMPTLPSFVDRFGLKGSAITAVDLVRGLAKLIGWDRIDVPGATGYVDTDYAGKGAAAGEALDKYDLVCVHVEAPDEAGHNRDVAGKLRAIEQIDRYVVGPVLERLRAEGDDWRILVLPDHPTPCMRRTHTPEPVPFAIAGKRIEAVLKT
ncbi:MAG: cofactor-independent phosphoglycerate mutase, partial [Planctomycetota bacterium]|nr:cofactor-independent phosphoglycerate mutase [Planctomycetota bacterium]